MTVETPRLALREPPGLQLGALGGRYLIEYLDKIDLALGRLDDDQIWARSGAGTNSIGNLILHLCGNLSLWVLASLGGQEYVRDRAGEFAADRVASKGQLLDELRRVVSESRAVLDQIVAERLMSEMEVQGYRTDVRGAVFHAVEHMSYHTGQIVQMAKQTLADAGGLEFYPHHRGESERTEEG